jgi:hypothetical protein
MVEWRPGELQKNRSLATSCHNRNDGGAPRASRHANSFNIRYNASNSCTSLGEMNTIPLRFVSENQA